MMSAKEKGTIFFAFVFVVIIIIGSSMYTNSRIYSMGKVVNGKADTTKVNFIFNQKVLPGIDSINNKLDRLLK